MRRAGEHCFHDILFPSCHTLDALAVTVLNGVGADRLTLDIAESRQRINAVLLRNQIFYVNLAADVHDFGASVVGVLVTDCHGFGFDNAENFFFACKKLVKFGNLLTNCLQFVLNLDSFKAG